MRTSIDAFCKIIDGTVTCRGEWDYIEEINIYPVSLFTFDTFFAINGTKYTTLDCGFGNSGNEDSVFGLKGTQDTHDCIEKMILCGAKTIIYDEEGMMTFLPGINYIKVSDSIEALGKVARYHIENQRTKVIAVTGSTGKTTLTTSIINLLSIKYNVQFTDFIRITYVGLIWYIISKLDVNTDWLVIEMQIDGKGQIDRLCEIVKLDVALIVNVSNAHLERFGTVEDILKEKLGVFRGLKKDGCLFINDECDILNRWRKEVDDTRVIPVRGDMLPSTLVNNGNYHLDSLALIHAFNEQICKMKVESVIDVYEKSKNEGRFQIFRGAMESTVVVDAYNASFLSTSFGIRYLSNHRKKRKILVLGSLLELGQIAEEIHRDIGRLINEVGNIDYAVFIGEATLYVMDEIKEGNCECVHVYTYQSALRILSRIGLDSNTVIYIKGSGAMRLELLALQLIGQIEGDEYGRC